MSEYLSDFIEFFGIDTLFNTAVTVQELIAYTTVAFIGAVITVAGIRCVFELIKIITDWSRFK